MIPRAVLLAATAAGLSPPPATAQTAPSLSDAALAAVLDICPGAIGGSFDLNDSAALASHGLSLLPDEFEAGLRKTIPGAKVAAAQLSGGEIMVIYAPGRSCLVTVSGPDRIAIRDRITAKLVSRNFSAARREAPGFQRQTSTAQGLEVGINTRQGLSEVTVSITRKP
jgi:hypothetical protein